MGKWNPRRSEMSWEIRATLIPGSPQPCRTRGSPIHHRILISRGRSSHRPAPFPQGRVVLRKYLLARCYVSETEVDMNGCGEQRGHCSPRAECSELAGSWNPTSREVDAITSKRAIRCPAGSTARRGRPGREPASPRVMGSLVSRGEAQSAM